MKLLLLEDQESILEILDMFLRLEGFTTLLAVETTTAREILQREEVALIISDIRMPKEDGISFAKSLRELEYKTPIIFYSSEPNGEDFYQKDILEIGNCRFLSKTFDMKVLKQAILEIIKKQTAKGI